DLALARALADQARPALESATKLVTYLADERVVLGTTLAFWAACHASSGTKARHYADQLVLGAALATVVRTCSSALSIASVRTAEWCMAGAMAFRAPAISGIPSPPAMQFSSARSPPSGAASQAGVCVRSFGPPLSSLPTRIGLLAFLIREHFRARSRW